MSTHNIHFFLWITVKKNIFIVFLFFLIKKALSRSLSEFAKYADTDCTYQT